MKSPLFILLFIVSTLSVYSETCVPSSASDLNQKWMAGEKKQVLEYAENLLKNNPNDLLGLIIEWDYAISFMDMVRMREIGPRLKEAVSKRDGPNFSKRKSWLISDVDVIINLLNSITPEMAEEDGKKGLIKGKRMNTLGHIQDLEADGYFKQINKTQFQLSENSAPKTPPTIKPSALIWSIIGLITLIAGVLFVIRKSWR